MANQYEHYIPIEERWVKYIPSHWKMLRLKRLFKIRKERNEPIKTEFILSLTANQGVVPISEKEGNGGNKPKEDISQYNICRKNDLLVNCMNVVAGSAGVSKWDGAVSPVYYPLILRDKGCGNVWYYHYIFRLVSFQRSLLGLGKGILMHESSTGKLNTCRMRISMDYLNNVALPQPPVIEQDKIVKFLDWQISCINSLILSKRKQIKLLNEFRESSISYYITHGIHKNAMRKTHIYWLDQVPAEWKETKLKHILKKERRELPLNAELLICSNSGEVKKRGESKIGLVAESNDVYQGVLAGDLLIHGMDTWHGAIAISEFDGMCTPVVHVCTTSQDKRFICYYLKMMAYKKVFKAISNGVRQNTSDFRSWDKVGDLLIAFPNINEQNQIADYLDNLVANINSLITNYQEQIEKLHDLKNIVIFNVVTGKINIQDIEIPAFDIVDEDIDEEKITSNDDIEDAEVE